MGGEWSLAKISDVCDLIVDCVNKTAPLVEGTTDFKMIRTTNIKNGRIDLESCRYVSKATFEQWTRRAKIVEGDIILTREAPIGEVGRFQGSEQVFLGQRLVQYRANPKFLDSRFMLYSFLGPFVQNQIRMHEGNGSVVSHIRVPDCSKFVIPLPPLPEQKAIAELLGSLDDKIELNRKQNATLEAMAQALFQSWFVDFDPVIDKALAAGHEIPEPLAAKARRRAALGTRRKPLPEAIAALFPDRFVETQEMGWVPEGWEVGKLFDHLEILGGGTPKTSIPEYWNGEVLWFSVVDAPAETDAFVVHTEKTITTLGLENSSAVLLPIGTTIISARGTVGKCALVGRRLAMNQSCYAIRGKSRRGDYHTYYNIKLNVADLANRGHGSVFNTITRDTFKSVLIPVCSPRLTQVFDENVSAHFDRMLANLHHRQTLSTLRDTLLPKLISGELRLPAAEATLSSHLP